MERKPPSSLSDFVAVLQRRKKWILVPAATVIVLAVALSPWIPRSYQSSTTIMVDAPRVPGADVRQTGANDETSRLQKIGLEVMSGKGLAAIVNKLNLYPELRKNGDINPVIATMRKNISVAPVPDAGDVRNGVGALTISYVGPTPRQTRDVTKELADLFIQENLKEGRQQTQGANTFLTSQLADAAQQLAAQQAKIRAFKDAHLGSLPEQTQANLQTINEYQAELQTNAEALAQGNQQRVYLQSVLNVNPVGDQGEAALVLTPLQLELAQKQEELGADLLKYTPEHPDVIRLKHDIAALKVEIRHAPKNTGSVALTPMMQMNGPSMNEQLRSQLVALNTDIRERNARQQQIERKLAGLQGSVGTLPAVQTEFAALDSDYQEMQKNYNTLLEKQQEAAMASAFNQGDQSEQFIILQPANLPTTPYRPDPVLLYMGEVLGGLFIGFICALVVEMRDDTMHNADEVTAYLKLPVIVALPECAPLADGTWSPGPSKS